MKCLGIHYILPGAGSYSISFFGFFWILRILLDSCCQIHPNPVPCHTSNTIRIIAARLCSSSCVARCSAPEDSPRRVSKLLEHLLVDVHPQTAVVRRHLTNRNPPHPCDGRTPVKVCCKVPTIRWGASSTVGPSDHHGRSPSRHPNGRMVLVADPNLSSGLDSFLPKWSILVVLFVLH